MNAAASHAARRIRHCAAEFKRNGEFELSARGKHSKMNRIIDIEFVRQDCLKLLDERRRTSASFFHRWLNDYLVQHGFDPVSKRTSRKWLTNDLGFLRHSRKKGVYFDGHDREDVQKYLHETYIPAMSEIEPRCRSYTGDDMEIVIEPEDRSLSLIRRFYHDESIFYTEDADKYYYSRDGDQELRKKGLGRCLHVSDFIGECCGFFDLKKVLNEVDYKILSDAGSLPQQTRSRVIIRPGKNADGWWDHEQLARQVELFLNLFEFAYPADTACLIFDCSANHQAFAQDALVVNRMNVNPGGKQNLMRDTQFVHKSQRGLPESEQQITAQTMVYDQDHPFYPGQAKGMYVVAQERGLIKEGTKPKGKCDDCKSSAAIVNDQRRDDCCLHRMLSLENDFAAEVSILVKIIESRGHRCLFLPKFHCELNPIECAWGDAKRFCRTNYDGSWANLQKRVPEALDAIPIARIRRWFRLADRFLDSYRKGLTGRLADFATRKYRSHRRLPDNIVHSELAEEFQHQMAARKERRRAK